MKKIISYALIAAAATLAFTSCNNESESPDFRYSYAMVENPDNSAFFRFTSDLGNHLWVTETYLPYFRPEDGSRIIAEYIMLSKDTETGEQKVRLTDGYRILTKEIVEITDENEDELGNDPIRILDMWIGNDYLNVEFRYLGYGTTHFINLGQDPDAGYTDGKTHLEFRHNANGDYASRWFWGMASFDLLDLQEGAQSPLQLVIHTKPYEVEGRDRYEIEYRFGAEDTGQRSYSLENVGQIE